ncbi:MAG: hypothetical protein IJC49_02890 [Clostridia bacterium]|nr:hypothetical protein [Clostridia bacterium]
MKKAFVTLIFFVLIIALVLTSCARIKSAVGIDRMENADAAVLPNKDDDSKTENPKDEHNNASVTVSMGEEMSMEIDESEFYKVGEPFLIDRNTWYASNRPVFECTVNSVSFHDDLGGIDKNKINMSMYYENGKWHTRNIDDYLDENGKLPSEYIFVLVDVAVKYVSGPDDVVDEIYSNMGSILYNYFPVSRKKVTQQMSSPERGEWTVVDYVYLDADGNTFYSPENLGGYFSVDQNTGTKEDGHFQLAKGEEMSWQKGILIEKSFAEKHGVVYAVSIYEDDGLYNYEIVELAAAKKG